MPGTPNAVPPPGQAQKAPPSVAPAFRRAPQITTPLPVAPPPTVALTPIAPGAAIQGPRNVTDFRGQRRETQEGGRTVFTDVAAAGLVSFLVIWLAYAWIYRWPKTRRSDAEIDAALTRVAWPGFRLWRRLRGLG